MKMMYVYIMTNKPNGTLYIGVTNNLIRRVWEHKNKVVEGFTCKYNLDKLVYYEMFEDELLAIQREKNLKKYNRIWKKELITRVNPFWRDLYADIIK